MPKIEVNKVAEICKRADIAPEALRQIVEEMNLAVQPDDGSATLYHTHRAGA